MGVDPLLVAKSLQYYKRREVQEAILRHAEQREISPRYGEGFGKRPDALSYPQDILEFAKRKATSFHCSEERWDSPLSIKTGASRKEMNDLRVGWDLVLDIDAKDWDLSRLTAWLFIEALKSHGVHGISVKFSGNKGWHIGVPFEAFPSSYVDENGKDVLTKDVFPEAPRIIASYLLEFIDDTQNGLITIDNDAVIFGWSEKVPRESWMSDAKRRYTIGEFTAITGKTREQLLESFCHLCNRKISQEQEQFFLFCHGCGHRTEKFTKEDKEGMEDAARVCPKCKHIMDFTMLKSKACQHDSLGYQKKFKLDEVIQFDTILIAGRHLYRMPYSLHEKSGLVSVVIDPADVLAFDKKPADPKTASFELMFLDSARAIPDEASALLRKALGSNATKEERKERTRPVMSLEFEEVTDAVPEEHFPPCIKTIFEGLTDGKKRAMFALTNFLTTVGWTPDMIEKRLHEWNMKNPEPLREVIIKGHMRQVRMKKERILPPNCKSFYQELGVCKPDEFCSRIKNPGPYAIKHVKLGAKAKKPKRPKAVEVKGEADKQEDI
jgi:DNA primase catalytic subunit